MGTSWRKGKRRPLLSGSKSLDHRSIIYRTKGHKETSDYMARPRTTKKITNGNPNSHSRTVVFCSLRSPEARYYHHRELGPSKTKKRRKEERELEGISHPTRETSIG